MLNVFCALFHVSFSIGFNALGPKSTVKALKLLYKDICRLNNMLIGVI